jgi:cobalt-zinc-cadmium efflux system outer membrane protein
MFLPKLKAAAVLVALQIAAGAGVLAQQGAETSGPPPVDRPAPLVTQPARVDPGPARLELTLDAAIERFFREDVDLRSKFAEIPEARADILRAGLRANPVVYADSQLVPYGSYTLDRPGGRTQFDVNISYPLDLSRKRQTRTARATKVIEAQYQDAVRLRIDRLSSAFADALRAGELAGLRAESIDRLDRAAEQARRRGGDRNGLRQIEAARDEARDAYDEAIATLDRKTRELASMIGLPQAEAAHLEAVGDLGRAFAIPATERLVAEALSERPDLVACRLGVARARADVKLQDVSRPASDAYILYQPYKLQGGLDDPLAWAMGITVPLPIYASWDTGRRYPLPVFDRNSGSTERARLNAAQNQAQLSTLERQVTSEVGQACRECLSTLDAARMAEEKADEAFRALDLAREKYEAGESTILEVLKAMSLDDEAARLRVEAQANHWRSRLSLNTAVGRRVLP